MSQAVLNSTSRTIPVASRDLTATGDTNSVVMAATPTNLTTSISMRAMSALRVSENSSLTVVFLSGGMAGIVSHLLGKVNVFIHENQLGEGKSRSELRQGAAEELAEQLTVMKPIEAILVVDDEEHERESRRKALTEEWLGRKVELLFARDGEGALEILKTNPRVGLMISDRGMLPMSGDVLAITARRQNNITIPIIIVSGASQSEALDSLGDLIQLKKNTADMDLLAPVVKLLLERSELRPETHVSGTPLRPRRSELRNATVETSEFLPEAPERPAILKRIVLGVGKRKVELKLEETGTVPAPSTPARQTKEYVYGIRVNEVALGKVGVELSGNGVLRYWSWHDRDQLPSDIERSLFRWLMAHKRYPWTSDNPRLKPGDVLTNLKVVQENARTVISNRIENMATRESPEPFSDEWGRRVNELIGYVNHFIEKSGKLSDAQLLAFASETVQDPS